jgi:parallel beta-helix repeat protein
MRKIAILFTTVILMLSSFMIIFSPKNVCADGAQELFSDGFESGNFDNWDVSEYGWIVTDSIPFRHSYGAYIESYVVSSDLIKSISTIGYDDISVYYFYKTHGRWGKQNDHVDIDWFDGYSWLPLFSHRSGYVKSWTQNSLDLPDDANNNPDFAIRFRADLKEEGSYFCLDDVYIMSGVNNIPSAYIDTINPNPATEEDAIYFSGHGEDTDGTITAYNWRSDINGQLSTGSSFSTSSLSIGTHLIYFKVKDNSDEWSSEVAESLIVNPSNFPPAADFTYSPSNPYISDVIQFDDTSTDSDGTITAWLWDFGGNNISTLENPNYNYHSGGTFIVSLKITDDGGATDLKTKAVTVLNEEIADIYVDDDADTGWYDATHVKTINGGIASASVGNTVFVYSGAYHENVLINKVVNLYGASKDFTIIEINDANNIGDAVYISAGGSSITGFTIQKCSGVVGSGEAGVKLFSNSNKVFGNIVTNNNNIGIILGGGASYNNISDNIITKNHQPGIYLVATSNNNIIFRNKIVENYDDGIMLWATCSGNVISENTIKDNGGSGIHVDATYSNPTNNHIYHNNFVSNNYFNAYFTTTNPDTGDLNIWDNSYPSGGNYWDDYTGVDTDNDGIGDTPYDTPKGEWADNQDHYPLMTAITQPPVADAGGPYSEYENVPIIFDSSNSYDPDGVIESYHWDFGDGTTGNGVSPIHIYTVVNNYTVTLTVTDDLGKTNTSTSYALILEDTEPPSNITGLTVADAKDGKLNLLWNKATDNAIVDHYNIYRDNLFITNVFSISYQDTGLTNGQLYTYNVSAVDASGNEGNRSDSAGGIPTASSSGGGGTPPGGGGFIPPIGPMNTSPIANANGPYYSFVNSTTTFDGSASNDSDGNITIYAWDFGDGTNGNGKITTHTYGKVGNYTVTLTVTDDDGKTNVDTTYAVITEKPNYPPNANFTYSPLNPTTDDTMQFTDLSIDTDGTIVLYFWNFSDGTNSTDKNPKHTYGKSGAYMTTLKVTDDDGATDIFSKAILVEESNKDITGTTTEKPKGTPGFELVFVIFAMALVLLWKRKRIK